ncbi:MAG: cysteine desulfurase family protein [Candidatus Omnitrophica bacterium]|nr:cysteine desulfurase family protein [Candidatus Omnitrophota bacterium]MDD5311171.1 cysteine desulfurase family protein [Candidatus Omnitrophota bacterium]MDD5547197.1 cysteine desulfurase family protein [Candidatus Omnitrophota bacterium]
MSKRKVYLDHNATTPLHPEVKKVMIEAMDAFGNPSSLHSFGRQARRLIDDARDKIGAFIGGKAEDIVFSGSGSEANNTVLNLLYCAARHCEAPHTKRHQIITSQIEHPCILEAAACLEERGIDVVYLPVHKTGKIDMDKYSSVISDKTALVTVMMANNEIGTIQDIKEIGRIAHKHGAMFHTDAIQAVGKIPVNVHELGVDYLSLSAHKIYGPKGVGALYVSPGVPFCPFIRGGHQERGRRAGTENTIGIAGFGKAIEMRVTEMGPEAKRLSSLKAKLKAGIEKNIPNIQFNGHPIDSLPGTLNVSFFGAEGEAILLYLDLEGIAVSTGSACASGSLDPSHVLIAAGLPAEEAHGSIRISMGRDNTEEDIGYTVEKIALVIDKIRKMSTVR